MKECAFNWDDAARQLDAFGYADLGRVLSDDQCAQLITDYDKETLYRSTISMKRYGFGEGEYKYYSYPLLPVIEALRPILYKGLAGIANHWNHKLGCSDIYPLDHQDYQKQCHDAGQICPTPLILKCGEGDYNCLHQDIYGDMIFPLQVVCLLSDPSDFEGGEFIITEQRPRMQSRAEVVPLRRGHAFAFPVSVRPKLGKRGYYRVQQKHGVSRIRSGQRYALGMIFHDAK